MTLAPVWRIRLSATVAALAAIWIGAAVAQGEFFLPTLLVGGLLTVALVWLQPFSLTTLLLGAVMCGYIVGNRGFAQLSPSNRLPMLPAELVLAVGAILLLIQNAWRREFPWRHDVVNYALLLWIVVGTVRLGLDIGTYGFVAIRDFALVYYACYFFLAQSAARTPTAVRFLHACLIGSCAVLLVTQPLFAYKPEFFLNTLTFHGIPLIYYKGDLTATYMAASALVAFIAYERTGRRRYVLLSLALTAGCLGMNNRSSLVGLAVVAIILAIAGRWRFALMQAAAGIVAAVILLFAAHVSNRPWQQTPLFGVYERAISVVDPFGKRSYSGADTWYKGDNNLFRAVWWKAVFEETREANVWLGVGFGYDLAARFVREYYPDAGDEFSARSPHNVLLTVFARMGLVGIAPFALAMFVVVRRAVQCARAGPSLATGFWCGALVILVSACFGVVLEGPMGAVVFWTMLGLANAELAEQRDPPAPELIHAPGATAAMEAG
jgi:hypothetical protein